MSDRGLVVVTGASAGLGATLAHRLDSAGYPVLALARRATQLEQLGLMNGMTAAVDVCDTQAVAHSIQAAVDRFGPVDLLVNNAGIMPLGEIGSQDSAQWQQVFDTNVLAPMRIVQLVLGPMRARRRGTIMMVTSLGAREIFPKHAAYCASKHALHAFTEALRMEAESDDLRVVEIAAGMIDTDLIASTPDAELRDEYLRSRRATLSTESVAQAIIAAYEQPRDVVLRELRIAPLGSAHA